MIETIQKLKQLSLEKTADFSHCFNMFMDLAAEPQFAQAGQALQSNKEFFQALLAPVTNFFGETITMTTLFPVSVQQYHLIHGFANLSNHYMVAFYFFDDIQCGIACASKLGEIRSEFFRITLIETSSSPSSLLH